jgi:hypothetical protein
MVQFLQDRNNFRFALGVVDADVAAARQLLDQPGDTLRPQDHQSTTGLNH